RFGSCITKVRWCGVEMVAIDRRLDALTSELTARERAVLWLRAWRQGEKVDERVVRFCPPQDKPEMHRICAAVEHASDEARGLLIILLEWMANAELEFHLVRIARAYGAYVESLEAVAKKPVPPLPAPWDTSRAVPIGWGRLIQHEERRTPKDWEQFRRYSLASVEEALALRWWDVLSMESVFDDIEAAIGEPLMHQESAALLDGLRDAIFKLAEEVSIFDEEFSLTGASGDHIDTLRLAVDWDAIRGTPKEKHAREWMHEKQRQELETWEREQSEELRNRSGVR
ncbi:MAG: hypothetical protein ABI577_00300, partial [bacterium]